VTLADVDKLLSGMTAERKAHAVTWARDALRRMGDQWALRTFGPQRGLSDRWAEYPDTLKAVYNCCGGWPQAPLPEHGLISKPRWWP
jgi:hypothetical protein